MSTKKLSPFSVEFWEAKGFSKEQAIFERNSRRPINWEYWFRKEGLSKEEAIEKAKETKNKNNKKGAKASANRSKEDRRKTSARCVEYWKNKGYSEEEAKIEIKRIQSTNTLRNYKKKYGDKRGSELFHTRKKDWVEKLSNMEIDRNCINANKLLKKFNNSIEDVSNFLYESRNMKIPKSIDEFKLLIENDIKEKPYLSYRYPEYLASYYPNVIFDLFKIKDKLKFMEPYCDKCGEEFLSRSRGYRKWLDDGSLLRSSYEISFYEILLKYNIDFEVDGLYNINCDSKMRYDFKVGNKYIEIAPLYGKNKEYTEKMNFKRNNFGAYILVEVDEYEPFVLSDLSEYI